MEKYAINIELDNGRVIGQTFIPVDHYNDVNEFLEDKYKHRVLTYDIQIKGATTNIKDMSESERNSFMQEKKKAVEVAKDFYYPQSVLEQIEQCETRVQLDIIMKSAKNKYI